MFLLVFWQVVGLVLLLRDVDVGECLISELIRIGDW